MKRSFSRENRFCKPLLPITRPEHNLKLTFPSLEYKDIARGGKELLYRLDTGVNADIEQHTCSKCANFNQNMDEWKTVVCDVQALLGFRLCSFGLISTFYRANYVISGIFVSIHTP